MGSISGIKVVSFRVLLGDASRLCPRADGEWHDMLKRCAPVKDGAAMPGEWARLIIKHTQKTTKRNAHFANSVATKTYLDLALPSYMVYNNNKKKNLH